MPYTVLVFLVDQLCAHRSNEEHKRPVRLEGTMRTFSFKTGFIVLLENVDLHMICNCAF